MEMYRERDKKLHPLSTYDKVSRDKFWYSTRKSRVVKYMNVVEDMYEDSETVASCVVEVTDGLKLRVGLTHRFSSEPFLVFNDDEQDLCLQTTLCSIVRAGGRMPGEVVVCIALAKVRGPRWTWQS